MNSNWLDSYYEALEFFYWEPQHIARKKDAESNLDTPEKVRKHLRKLEVTLNHNISQFLLLAPKSLRRKLFGALFEADLSLQFNLHGREFRDHIYVGDSVQPDFLFVSESEVVSLEMKIAAKSSVQQVIKYAFLGLAVEMKEGSQRAHYLGFLGVGEFHNQWKEKFESIESLRTELEKADLIAFLARQPMRFRDSEARLRRIIEELRFSFISYQGLAKVLRSDLPEESDSTSAAEVYTNLIRGLLAELHDRDLAR